MKKQLVLGLLGACVLSGNAQTFKEWQDPEINACLLYTSDAADE